MLHSFKNYSLLSPHFLRATWEHWMSEVEIDCIPPSLTLSFNRCKNRSPGCFWNLPTGIQLLWAEPSLGAGFFSPMWVSLSPMWLISVYKILSIMTLFIMSFSLHTWLFFLLVFGREFWEILLHSFVFVFVLLHSYTLGVFSAVTTLNLKRKKYIHTHTRTHADFPRLTIGLHSYESTVTWKYVENGFNTPNLLYIIA